MAANLRFHALSSTVDISFWQELESRKINTYKLNQMECKIHGHWSTSAGSSQTRLTVAGQSFGEPLNSNSITGTLRNVNTIEEFKSINKQALLEEFASELKASILDGSILRSSPQQPAPLQPFLCLTFADIKAHKFLYWFAFPALAPSLRLPGTAAAAGAGAGAAAGGAQAQTAVTVVKPQRAAAAPAVSLADAFPPQTVAGLCAALRQGQGQWQYFVLLTGAAAAAATAGAATAAAGEGLCGGVCVGSDGSGGEVRLLSLLQYDQWRAEGSGSGGGSGSGVVLGVCDHSSGRDHPGWRARNLLALAALRWRLPALSLLCLRQGTPADVAAAAAAAAAATAAASTDADTAAATADAAAAAAAAEAVACGQSSVLFQVTLPVAAEGGPALTIDTVGWERNARGKLGPRLLDLAPVMSPARLAAASADLNLRLMRWRLLPSLNLPLLSSQRCLLLGAGTLGCAVARCLLGWGVRHITLVDGGRVSYSNPVRQWLYELPDCAGAGKPKAEAAAAALRRVFPGVTAEGHQLYIPMPGHPVGAPDSARARAVEADCARLSALIDSHDVVFLLTDTRESRWLPTLLCAAASATTTADAAPATAPAAAPATAAATTTAATATAAGESKDKGKASPAAASEASASTVPRRQLLLNAALGFDSFLVMRHGPALHSIPPPAVAAAAEAEAEAAATAATATKAAGAEAGAGAEAEAASPALKSPQPSPSPSQRRRLGCYFCNDVVAPADSLSGRTLDQQCTVTRPGLAPIAAAMAVELMVAVTHCEAREHAAADVTTAVHQRVGNPLGLLPHQIRGFLSHYNNVLVSASAFPQCVACSAAVVDAYNRDGFSFLLRVFNDPLHLEALTGLQALKQAADALDWDDEEDEDGEDW